MTRDARVDDAAGTTVSALDRGLALLQCFAGDDRTLGSTELSRRTGIPRPSVVRLAATLITHRLLHADGDGYRLGAGVMDLAHAFLASLDIREAARTPMAALAEATGGTVYLAVRDALDMVLVEACRPRSAMLATTLDIGSRAPLATAALGRAWLAGADAAQRDALFERLRAAHGDAAWTRLLPPLRKALAEFSRSGWCVSAGEFHRDVNSVAVAIRGPRGEILALNCGGSAHAFTEARLRGEIGPALLRMAADIAARIGGAAVTTGVTPHTPPASRARRARANDRAAA